MSLQRLYQLVRDNDPVNAGSVDRPLSQLAGNVEYLWEIIQAAELGSTVYARQVTIEAAAQVGMPVYFNPISQQFERALAQVDTDLATGTLVTTDSSQVWGIVAEKFSATLADLLLFGVAPIDISAAVANGQVQGGTYYLSSVGAGQLVKQRPPVTVPVLRALTNGTVFVNPSFVDFLDAHRHYKFELACSPAGSVDPVPFQRHVIENPQADWPGWLPATSAYFPAADIPVGAVFGYNLNAHPQLKALWPPTAVQHAYLDWDRGDDPGEGYEGVPLGNGGLCLLTRTGIWWMSNCWGDVPWPKTLTTHHEFSETEHPEDIPPECPRDTYMSLILWFTKITFATDASLVTSLQSGDPRLKIYCTGTTTPASVGDLTIDLDLSLSLGVDTLRGFLVIKDLDSAGKLNRGPVAEGVYTTGNNVLLSGDAHTPLNPLDPTGTQMYHGRVRVEVLSQPTRELQAQLTRLDGAIEENYPVLYVGLPPDAPTGFISKFEIPADAPSGSSLVYRARLLGRVDGNLPQLTVEYLKSTRPIAGLDIPCTVGGVYTALTMDTVATLASDECVEAQSNAFSVEPGDIVYIHVSRDPTDDGYLGDVGFMEQVVILSTGS
jgi:hypothetical protein